MNLCYGKRLNQTKNYSAPLRTQIEFEDSKETQTLVTSVSSSRYHQARSPIALTGTNLILLQKQLKGLVKGNFEFRNTRNGTRIVTKEMVDFSAIKSYFRDQKMY
jgi:hypothetical protein